MGERKGTNHYYPPDFDPAVHRSLNGYWGTHALRERARKLDRGILIIRFEMPFNCWCTTCHNSIGMGVRYNSEKTKVGMYYSTPIYKFKMRCHLCAGDIEIQTDPQNYQYVIVSGARRKEQRWDGEENGQIIPEDRDTQKKLATDAMFNLEHTVKDKAKVTDTAPSLKNIEARLEVMKDDYSLNQMARQKFREEKKAKKASKDADRAFMSRHSLRGAAFSLLPSEKTDHRQASLIQLKNEKSITEKQIKRKEDLEKESIFDSGKCQPPTKRPKTQMLGFSLNPVLSKKLSSSTIVRVRSKNKDGQPSKTPSVAVSKSVEGANELDSEVGRSRKDEINGTCIASEFEIKGLSNPIHTETDKAAVRELSEELDQQPSTSFQESCELTPCEVLHDDVCCSSIPVKEDIEVSTSHGANGISKESISSWDNSAVSRLIAYSDSDSSGNDAED